MWQLSPQFMTTAHAACEQSSSSKYAECMIGQMTKAGAPADAVGFTRELYKESHGEFGVMTGFQDEGPVAFAWITYPLRANTNSGLLLLNRQPRIVNVEDLKLLDVKAMKQSSQFQDAKLQFPNIDVWPGDRDGRYGRTRKSALMAGSSTRSLIRCAMAAMPAPTPGKPSSTGISTRPGSLSGLHFKACSIRLYSSSCISDCPAAGAQNRPLN
jgi:hypothetical protein